MKIDKNLVYEIRWGSNAPRLAYDMNLEFKSHGKYRLSWMDIKYHVFDVELEEENDDFSLFDMYNDDGKHVSDLEVRRITKKSPLLKDFGLKPEKIQSDSEAEAYLQFYVMQATTPMWKKK